MSEVFIRRLASSCSEEEAERSINLLFEKAGFEALVVPDGFCMLKLHFGERANPNHIEPKFVRPLVRLLQEYNMRVFCADTNTLYRGGRHNAVDHLMTAYEHGFTPDYLGCPVIILDGLVGMSETRVKIEGKHFKEVQLPSDLLYVDTLFLLSHLTGHIGVGMGCAIKNLGMGLSTRGGKLAQHNQQPLSVDKETCNACGTCEKHCPEGAITVSDYAEIDDSLCINCGYCIAVCKYGAIKFSWELSSQLLQERIAEYATGVLKTVRRTGYFNFLLKITKECDCLNKETDIICNDIGIVASLDAVAVDVATSDLVKDECGKDILRELTPNIDYRHQMRYLASLGFGSLHYTVSEV